MLDYNLLTTVNQLLTDAMYSERYMTLPRDNEKGFDVSLRLFIQLIDFDWKCKKLFLGFVV